MDDKSATKDELDRALEVLKSDDNWMIRQLAEFVFSDSDVEYHPDDEGK